VRGPLSSDKTESLPQAAIGGLGIVHLASWLVSDAITSGQFGHAARAGAANVTQVRAAVHAERLPRQSHTAKARLFIAHL
jgi:DNA-binding transcriptional LysR family regulator